MIPFRNCQKVIGTYREMLQGEDWMTESTREKAIESWTASDSCGLSGLLV